MRNMILAGLAASLFLGACSDDAKSPSDQDKAVSAPEEQSEKKTNSHQTNSQHTKAPTL